MSANRGRYRTKTARTRMALVRAILTVSFSPISALLPPKPIHAAAHTYKEHRVATGVSYPVLGQECSSPMDVQNLIQVRRSELTRQPVSLYCLSYPPNSVSLHNCLTVLFGFASSRGPTLSGPPRNKGQHGRPRPADSAALDL